MNKLSFGGPVWLASDIHLGSHNPRTSDAFYKFLANARQQSSALILLGDIFDVWVGDDWITHPPDWLKTALEHLQLTAKTIPLLLMGGNRDFLIGENLAKSLGAHLIGSPCILEVTNLEVTNPESQDFAASGTPKNANLVQSFLLAHGDEFCTADLAYQRFRSVVRNPVVQTLFLALPLSLRRRIAGKARVSSMQTVRNPYDGRYDVQDKDLAQRLRQADLSTCIHGHTHRPGTYPVASHQGSSAESTPSQSSASQTMRRWVLPDWELDHPDQSHADLMDSTKTQQRPSTAATRSVSGDVRGGWMQIDQNGPRLIDLTHLDLRCSER